MDANKYFEGVSEYRMLAKHEVGQNFLVDIDVAKRIVEELEAKPGEKVIEIGPGAGSLTFFLKDLDCSVEAIDIDESLIGKLQNDFGNAVNVHYGNGAKWDYDPYDRIIGNLPYYITSLLIERALLLGKNAKRMVFMVQKEAAERLLAGPSSKEYGPLSILIAWLSNAKRLFNVRKTSFVPAPHIDSSVIGLTMKQRPENIEKTYKLVQSLFLQRRKTLLNNLKNYLHDGEKAANALQKANLSPTLRPEQVTPEQYLALSKAIFG